MGTVTTKFYCQDQETRARQLKFPMHHAADGCWCIFFFLLTLYLFFLEIIKKHFFLRKTQAEIVKILEYHGIRKAGYLLLLIFFFFFFPNSSSESLRTVQNRMRVLGLGRRVCNKLITDSDIAIAIKKEQGDKRKGVGVGRYLI